MYILHVRFLTPPYRTLHCKTCRYVHRRHMTQASPQLGLSYLTKLSRLGKMSMLRKLSELRELHELSKLSELSA